MSVEEDEITEQDLLALHEDILEQSERAVRELLDEFIEDGLSIMELCHRELAIEPLAEDHELNKLPLSALHRAVLVGSTNIIGVILESDGNININLALSTNGYSLLHVAAAVGSTNVVNYLAANGASVNAKDKTGQTPLHVAAKHDHDDLARILVVKGADIETPDNNGLSALHVAAKEGSANVVAFLLKRGASVCAKDKKGNIALHHAQFSQSVDIVSCLIDAQTNVNDVNTDLDTPLHISAVHYKEPSSGSTKTSKGSLVRRRFSSKRENRNSSFGEPRARKSVQIRTESLDSNNSDVTDGETENNTSNNNLDSAVDVLLRSKANVNAQNSIGDSPLHMAVTRDSLELVTKLISNGAEVNTSSQAGNTPIFYARSTEIAECLIANGANISHTNKAAMNVLHFVCSLKVSYCDLVILLCKRGNGFDTNDNAGLTPLQIACSKGHIDIVELLELSGFDGQVKDNQGRSCLQLALENGHSSVAEYLLSLSECELDSVDSQKCSALHTAVINNNLNIVRLLLSKQCKANLINVKGQTPTDLAAVYKKHEILKHLLTHSGKLVEFVKSNGVQLKETPLLKFARDGNAEICKILCDQGENIDAVDSSGMSALHIALSQGNESLAAFLLSIGANPNTTDKHKSSPLHAACSKTTSLSLIRKLLAKIKQLSGRDVNNNTPLHLAVMLSSAEVVGELISKGADVSVCDGNNYTALFLCLATAASNVKVRNDLIAKAKLILPSCSPNVINRSDTSGKTCLHYCAMIGDVSLLKLLLKQGSDIGAIDTNGQTALHVSCSQGLSNIAEILLEKCSNAEVQDKLGQNALMCAVTGGDLDTVELILMHTGGNTVNNQRSDGATPLHNAIHSGHLSLVEVLLGHDADVNIVNQDSMYPLHFAAMSAPRNIVNAVISPKSINGQDARGQTPLHKSFQNKDSSIIPLLLRRGAHIDVTDNDGNTILHYCCSRGLHDHVHELVDNGANVDVENNNRQCPIHKAVESGEVDVVEVLIAHEANLNVKDHKMLTPLLIAVQSDNEEIALTLIDNDADVQCEDNFGENALHKSVKNNKVRPPLLRSLVRKGLSPVSKNNDGFDVLTLLKTKQHTNEQDLMAALGVS